MSKKVQLVLVPIIIVTTLAVSLLSGCTAKEPGQQGTTAAQTQTTTAQAASTTEEEKLPPVKLVAYFVGDEGADHELVLNEVNRHLSEKLNATMEMTVIPTADVNQRYPLIFASGESFDLVFAAGWTGYKAQAEKGGYLELTDEMLNKYMPVSMSKMQPMNWKPVMVNNKKYMFPRTDYTFNPYVIVVRGDLRAKYNLPEIKSFADFELFLDTISNNEKNILPYGDNNNANCWILPNTLILNVPNGWSVLTSGGSDFMHFKIDDMTGDQAFVREETPEYLEFAKKMVDWRKKGYWSASALTAKGTVTSEFEAGKSAAVICQLTASIGLYNKLTREHPDWKVEVYDSTFGKPVSYTIPIAGFALSANTKNAERALMTLELFKTDRELYDLAQYGIKGKHYELTSDGKVLPGPDQGNNGNISYYGLKVGDMERINASTFPGYDEMLASFKEREYFNPSQMFSLTVTDNIKNEYAACKNIYDTMRPIIHLGFNDDPEKTIQDYLKQMYDAGYQKLIEEEKKQLKEFLAGF